MGKALNAALKLHRWLLLSSGAVKSGQGRGAEEVWWVGEPRRNLSDAVIRRRFTLACLRWPASSRQRFGFAKWCLCRLSSCAGAGASRREGVARPR